MSWYMNLTLAQQDAAPAAPPTATAPAAAPQTGSNTAAAGANTTTTKTGADAASKTGKDAASNDGAPGIWMLMIVMVGVFWLLIMLPQRRDKKKRNAMLDSLKKGDKVQTIGGILGTVLEVRDYEVIVKVDESANTRLHMARGAIQAVLPDGKPQESR